MTSSADADRVRKAIARVPSVRSVEIDLLTEIATVDVDPAAGAPDSIAIEEAVSAAGYEGTLREAAAIRPIAAVIPRLLAVAAAAGAVALAAADGARGRWLSAVLRAASGLIILAAIWATRRIAARAAAATNAALGELAESSARVRVAVTEAQASRAPLASVAGRAASWTPAVCFVLAAAAVAVNLRHDLVTALGAAVAALAAAAPTAFALSIPTARALATTRAAQNGILFRNAEALERPRGAAAVPVDKGSSISARRPVVEAHAAVPGGDAGRVLAVAAAVERAGMALTPAPFAGGGPAPGSSGAMPVETAVPQPHLPRAIIAYAEAKGILIPPADGAAFNSGMGLSAAVAGAPVLVGSRIYLAQQLVPMDAADALAAPLAAGGRSVIFVAIDGRLAGALAVREPIDDAAPAAVGRLRRAGLGVTLCTGDGGAAAAAAAGAAGIGDVQADLRPDEKKHAVVALRAAGAVAAVGDAVDDEPLLAAADLGIALHRGAEPSAIESLPPVTVLDGNLGGAASALLVARRAVGIMRQNLAVALLHHGALAAAILAGSLGALAPAVAACSGVVACAAIHANSRRAGVHVMS